MLRTAAIFWNNENRAPLRQREMRGGEAYVTTAVPLETPVWGRFIQAEVVLSAETGLSRRITMRLSTMTNQEREGLDQCLQHKLWSMINMSNIHLQASADKETQWRHCGPCSWTQNNMLGTHYSNGSGSVNHILQHHDGYFRNKWETVGLNFKRFMAAISIERLVHSGSYVAAWIWD